MSGVVTGPALSTVVISPTANGASVVTPPASTTAIPSAAIGIPGNQGAQGTPGVDAVVQTLATSATVAHASQPDPAAPGQVMAAAQLALNRFGGVFTATGGAATSQPIQHAGPVAPTTYNLGAGSASAVGVDAAGKPVRVGDPTCVSRLNVIGWCDTAGTLTVAPTVAYVYNVRDFGAVGDAQVTLVAGVYRVVGTDDTAAIQSAVAAIRAAHRGASYDRQAAVLYFPKSPSGGMYTCSTLIDVSTSGSAPGTYFPGITFRGDGSSTSSADQPLSSLCFTGSGAGTFIDARSAVGFTVERLAIMYDGSTGWTGKLIDLSHGITGSDGSGTTLRDSTFRDACRWNVSCSTLVYLDRSISAVIDRCVFAFAQVGVWGQDAGYCNVVDVTNCFFNNLPTAAILNPGESWTIYKGTFEGIPAGGDVDGPGSNPVKRLRRAVGSNSAYIPTCFRFIGNWCGDLNEDVYTSPVPWVDPGASGGFIRSIFESNLFANSGVDPLKRKVTIGLGASDAVSIRGNDLDIVDFSGLVKPTCIVLDANTFSHASDVALQGFDFANLDFKGVAVTESNVFAGELNARSTTTISGHVVTRPGGTSVVTATCDAVATIDVSVANDASGYLYLTINGTTLSDPQPLISVTFAYPFDTLHGNPAGYLPKVFFAPCNAAAAALGNQVYSPIAGRSGGAGFTVVTTAPIVTVTPTLYVWQYWVVQ